MKTGQVVDNRRLTEGLFVGGSSGSALSGALRYLHSPDGQHIASDANANVVIVLPDGVRNYMSKPWFLENNTSEAGADLRDTIRKTIGRDLGDVKSVVKEAEKQGQELEGGAGLEKGVNGLHINGNGH